VAAAVWAIIWLTTVTTLNIIKRALIRSLKLFHVTRSITEFTACQARWAFAN